MAYLNADQLSAMGFKALGHNVLISDKAAIYNADQMEIGENSRIDDFCVMSGKLKIGRNVHIAVYCNLAGGSEGLEMDDFSGLAYGCQLFTQSDDYSGRSLTNPTVPDKYKKEIKKMIKVGRHVIIGANSIVMPGVAVAEGTSVGAMSMVTKSTEPWSIYFGCPAKRLRSRKRDLLEMEAAYLSESS